MEEGREGMDGGGEGVGSEALVQQRDGRQNTWSSYGPVFDDCPN